MGNGAERVSEDAESDRKRKREDKEEDSRRKRGEGERVGAVDGVSEAARRQQAQPRETDREKGTRVWAAWGMVWPRRGRGRERSSVLKEGGGSLVGANKETASLKLETP